MRDKLWQKNISTGAGEEQTSSGSTESGFGPMGLMVLLQGLLAGPL
jgi:hypothetical protein